MTSYVNSIQKVSITIAALSTTGTATISAAVGTQFIIWNGQTTDQTVNSSEALAAITISGTTITATRGLGTVGTITVNLTVIDGTASLIKTVQTGTIPIGVGNATGTATISAVTAANTVLHLLGYRTSAGTFNITDNPVLTFSGTTITATLSTTASANLTIAYEVIEFQGAALATSTQAVAKAWTNTTQTTTATISAVTLANAMLFYCGQQAQQSTDFQYAQLTSTTAITLTSGVANFEAVQYNCYVANFVSGVFASAAQRGSVAMASVTSNTATVTATGSNSHVNYTGIAQTSGATANYNIINSTLAYSSPTVTAQRNTGTGTVSVGYEVIDWVGGPAETILADKWQPRQEVPIRWPKRMSHLADVVMPPFFGPEATNPAKYNQVSDLPTRRAKSVARQSESAVPPNRPFVVTSPDMYSQPQDPPHRYRASVAQWSETVLPAQQPVPLANGWEAVIDLPPRLQRRAPPEENAAPVFVPPAPEVITPDKWQPMQELPVRYTRRVPLETVLVQVPPIVRADMWQPVLDIPTRAPRRAPPQEAAALPQRQPVINIDAWQPWQDVPFRFPRRIPQENVYAIQPPAAPEVVTVDKYSPADSVVRRRQPQIFGGTEIVMPIFPQPTPPSGGQIYRYILSARHRIVYLEPGP